jgi:hypothetical protein
MTKLQTSSSSPSFNVPSISRQIELLNFHGRIPARRYAFIDEIRKARNGFVHQAVPCTDGLCEKAYSVLTCLVEEEWCITLPHRKTLPTINL